MKDDRKNSNMKLYVLSYLVQGMFGGFWSMFLPVYLENELKLTSMLIFWIPLFSKLPIILKPVFANLSDRADTKPYYRKYYMITGVVLFIVSIIIAGIIPPVEYLFLFSLMIFLAYLGTTLFDAIIDSLMVYSLHTSKERKKTTAFFMVSNNIGNIIATMIFGGIEVYSDLSGFSALFLGCGIIAVPILVLIIKMQENRLGKIKNIEKEAEESESKLQDKTKNKEELSNPHLKNQKLVVILTLFFALLLNGDMLSDWVYEPYIRDTFGADEFAVFSLWVGLLSILMIVGYLIAIKIGEGKDKKALSSQKYLSLLLVIFGIYYLIIPILNLSELIIVTIVIQLLSGITYILFLNVFMYLSQILRKQMKGTIYQLFLMVFAISKGLFASLGLILKAESSPTNVFIISSIPMFVSGVLILIIRHIIKTNNKKTKK
ncbi:MAG: hypothetical protein GF364_05510 [Candidatus Lokiarchaeota archaeon]|nr:hypothetical protein [Candidatus Lokiarchaeota archaeon]